MIVSKVQTCLIGSHPCWYESVLPTHLPMRVCIPHTLTDLYANLPRQLPTTTGNWCRLGRTRHSSESHVKSRLPVSRVVLPQFKGKLRQVRLLCAQKMSWRWKQKSCIYIFVECECFCRGWGWYLVKHHHLLENLHYLINAKWSNACFLQSGILNVTVISKEYKWEQFCCRHCISGFK